MAVLKVKSLDPELTDEQLELQGCQITSFMSFGRAIDQALIVEGKDVSELKGYRVTDQGLELIWK